MKTLLSLFLLLAVGASAATGIKISEYPNTPVLTNSELFIVAVTNTTPATNRNITYGQLRSLLASNNFVGSFTGDGRNVSNVVAAYATTATNVYQPAVWLSTNIGVVFTGDSITTEPAPPDIYKWPNMLLTNSAFSRVTWKTNNAVAGYKLSDISGAYYTNNTQPWCPRLTGVPCALFVAIGANDVTQGSGMDATFFPNLTNFWNQARNVDGFWPLVVATIMPRTNSYPYPQDEARREWANWNIRAACGQWDILMDWAAWFPDPSDTNIFNESDGTHPTIPYGNQQLAKRIVEVWTQGPATVPHTTDGQVFVPTVSGITWRSSGKDLTNRLANLDPSGNLWIAGQYNGDLVINGSERILSYGGLQLTYRATPTSLNGYSSYIKPNTVGDIAFYNEGSVVTAQILSNGTFSATAAVSAGTTLTANGNSDTATLPSLFLRDAGSSSSRMDWGLFNGGNSFGGLDFATGASAGSAAHYSFTKLHIEKTGEVGIGTVTPPEKLSVIGNISSSGAVIATNAFVMPPVSAGPVWCTNGLAAMWNSNNNGQATIYLRTSAVGATTYADKLVAP